MLHLEQCVVKFSFYEVYRMFVNSVIGNLFVEA